MADIVASVLVQHFQNLLGRGNKLSGGLRDDFQFLKNEFKGMTSFLRVANTMEEKDPEVAIWVKKVREIAHDTEDILDEYDILFSDHQGMFFRFIKNLIERCRLASKIKSIKSKVRDVSEGHHKCRARYEAQDQTRRSAIGNYSDVDELGDATVFQNETNPVGIQERKGELISLLFGAFEEEKVIAVVGMGGVGKTALVRMVYEDKDVNSKFQYHAWVTVSATYNSKELEKSIIKQFCEDMKNPIPQEVLSMDDNELKEFIKDFFKGKKYIIVLDDVRDMNFWDDIKYALNEGNSNSRIILTTRRKYVAFGSCMDLEGRVYEVKPLSSEESWVLFCRKEFKGDNNCPLHLKDISERIVRKCGGLPLAILAIGGTLALREKERLDYWEMIYAVLDVEVEDEGMPDKVKRIFLLSFLDLPHNLKICLLYLSIFPKGHVINSNQVIRLWISEGFLEERDHGLTMEEVGMSYLNKLVNGSFLHVVKTRSDGRLKTFLLFHEIVWEIIDIMSKRENFTMVAGEKAMSWPNKVRRLAIHGPLLLENRGEKSSSTTIFKHLRSLLVFSPDDLPPQQPFLSEILLSGGCRVMKILELRGAPIEKIPEEVFKLYFLEYLSLRSTNVKVIPKSIGELGMLQTLDLKDTFVTELPIGILNLQRLRYLMVYNYMSAMSNSRSPLVMPSFRAPYKIGCLVSLQRLNYIEAGGEKDGVKIVREIGKLTQLRRLGVAKLRKEDGKDLCFSLERLTNLRSLSVGSNGEDEILDLQYNILGSAPNQLITNLALFGRLEKVPQWIPSLECLTKVILGGSRLEDEPLQYLEDLPNLERIILYDAYKGEELHFKAGKFQRLKELWVWCLNGLRTVKVENNSMGRLERMIFIQNELMEDIPSGIEHLRNLHLILRGMPQKCLVAAQNLVNRTQAKVSWGI